MADPASIEIDAFLADSVEAINGKLYALGAGWNLVWSQSFPFRHDRVGLGIIVRVPYTSTNQNHTMEVTLETADGAVVPMGHKPDGEDVTRFGANFNVGRPPVLQPGDEQLIPMAVNISGLPLNEPGRYEFVFRIDNEPRKRLPFRVASATELGIVAPSGFAS